MTAAEAILLAALGILVIAALFDLVRMEIPDSLPILLLLLSVAHWLAAPEPGLWSRIAALAIMLGLGLLLFSRGWMGGGDVKLLIAMAGLVGVQQLPAQLIGIALAGGLLSVLMLALRAGLAAARPAPAVLPLVLRRESPMPYAVAIAAGTWAWAWRAGALPL